MGIIGREEEFARTANTKQITGEGGEPLATDNDNVLVTRGGPEEEEATVTVDGWNLLRTAQGGDGALEISPPSGFGANMAYFYLNSTDGEPFSVDYEIEDSDKSNITDTRPDWTKKRTELYDSIPLVGDYFTIQIFNANVGVTNNISGSIHLSNGAPNAHSQKNKLTVAHDQQTASSADETITVTADSNFKVPDGATAAIKALPGNSGTIYLGSSERSTGATASSGMPIGASEGVGDLAVSTLGSLEVFVPNSGDGFAWMVEREYVEQ